MTWIQLSDARAFDFTKPRPISIEVLAESLSRLARFTGHTRAFYSVAQHSVLVSRLVPDSLAAYGLLHDAAEAVLGDLSTPLKNELDLRTNGWLRSTERAIHTAILGGFGLPKLREEDECTIKHADGLALRREIEDLMAPGEKRFELEFIDVRRVARIRHTWSPYDGAARFLERWNEVRPVTRNEKE